LGKGKPRAADAHRKYGAERGTCDLGSEGCHDCSRSLSDRAPDEASVRGEAGSPVRVEWDWGVSSNS
jgi:hypothetical protein